jgi:hypothetical protein
MKLQELINQTELDMTVNQVKAFFLGAMTAERALSFSKALDEILDQSPEAKGVLETEFKRLWDQVQINKVNELQHLFSANANLKEFLLEAKDQLDFYLTALSLSGTNVESCKNEELGDLIDELEDAVMDLDEYLSEDSPNASEGMELKEMLMETWQNFIKKIIKQ